MLKENDKIIIKHQKEQGVFVVQNSNDPTDNLRVGGDPVGFYVRIGNDKMNNLGYHLDSLEKVEEK